MKMHKNINFAGKLALTLVAFILLTNAAQARGGGGGGGRGFGMGGGGRDFGGMGGVGRDFGGRDFGGMGRGFDGDRGLGDGRFGDDGFRRDDGPLSRVSEDALRSGADRLWSPGDLAGRGLASDGLAFGARDSAITRNLSPAYLTGRGADLRRDFNRYDAFRNNFWNRYPNAWWYRGWGDWYPWGAAGWSDLAGYWDVPVVDTPTDYDYGDNIYYNGDNVYYGSQPVATTENYYYQAQSLATAPPPVSFKNGQPTNTGPASSWKPLGVYALSQNGEPSTTLFQLAVNKDGTIRGNYYNSLTEDEKPIKGKVDKKTMRAAWMVEGNSTIIYEAGLSNLLHPQCTALVHKGKSNTEQWLMVKMDKSMASAKQSPVSLNKSNLPSTRAL